MYCKKFKECETYEQEGGPNIEYRSLLPKGTVADLGIGMITLEGPTSTATNKHTEWRQVYLVIKGTGTIIMGDKEIQVKEPTIIEIPYNTDHSVRLRRGQKMQYIYVNQFTKHRGMSPCRPRK